MCDIYFMLKHQQISTSSIINRSEQYNIGDYSLESYEYERQPHDAQNRRRSQQSNKKSKSALPIVKLTNMVNMISKQGSAGGLMGLKEKMSSLTNKSVQEKKQSTESESSSSSSEEDSDEDSQEQCKGKDTESQMSAVKKYKNHKQLKRDVKKAEKDRKRQSQYIQKEMKKGQMELKEMQMSYNFNEDILPNNYSPGIEVASADRINQFSPKKEQNCCPHQELRLSPQIKTGQDSMRHTRNKSQPLRNVSQQPKKEESLAIALGTKSIEIMHGIFQQPVMQHLHDQMETLQKNTVIHHYYHNESRELGDGGGSERSSLGSISSAEERDCELLFKGGFTNQFQCLQQLNLWMESYAKQYEDDKKHQNSSGISQCLYKIFCPRGSKVAPGMDSNLMSTLDLNQSVNLKGSPSKTRRPSAQRDDQRHQMMNTYIMSQMDLPGRVPHKHIKPESLAFHNEMKITRTKTDGFLNTSKIGGNLISKKTDEFDTNQGYGKSNDIKTFNSPQQLPSPSEQQEEENSDASQGNEQHQNDDDQEMQDFDMEHEYPKSCWMKCNQKLQKMMINPYQSKKIKYFHAILSLTMYLDIIMTSLLIGSWDFQTKETSDIMYSEKVFTVIIIIQAMGMGLNFIKGQMIDVQYEDDPTKIALAYLKGTFIQDAVSIIPYNIVKKDLLVLRLIKIKQFTMYQGFLNDFLLDNSQFFLMSNEAMIKLVEFLNMIIQLILLSHFYACLWILIGEHQRKQFPCCEDEPPCDDQQCGWITMLVAKHMQEDNFGSLYITSFYWVITSFSSVGYGEIVGNSSLEYGYQMFIEMLGIAVFGMMIGTIQKLFLGFKVKDQNEEQQESIDLWLIKLDRAKPSSVISGKLFSDVKDYFYTNFQNDYTIIKNSEFFYQLKPRLQKLMLDYIFKSKYDKFNCIFDECCIDFQRELIWNSKFLYYAMKQELDIKISWVNGIDLPVIEEAYEPSKNLYLILSGTVHVMDQAGLYNYGIIQQGSYFGDVSILTQKPNKYSYMFDPHQQSPLKMLQIKAEKFIEILNRYPLEREILFDRAESRREMFDCYKTRTLLGYMKAIINNPSVIKQNLKHKDKNYTMIQRLRFLRELNVKLSLFKLFIRQYEILRRMKKLYSKSHNLKKKNNQDEFREFVSKSLISPMASPSKMENITITEGNLTNTLGGNNTMMSKAPHNKTNFYKFSMQQVQQKQKLQAQQRELNTPPLISGEVQQIQMRNLNSNIRNHHHEDGGMVNDTEFYSRASQNVLDYSIKNPRSQSEFKHQKDNRFKTQGRNPIEEQKVATIQHDMNTPAFYMVDSKSISEQPQTIEKKRTQQSNTKSRVSGFRDTDKFSSSLALTPDNDMTSKRQTQQFTYEDPYMSEDDLPLDSNRGLIQRKRQHISNKKGINFEGGAQEMITTENSVNRKKMSSGMKIQTGNTPLKQTQRTPEAPEKISFENLPCLSESRKVMLELSEMNESYANFRDCSLSQLEQKLLINVEEIRFILDEYLKIKYNETNRQKNKNNCFAKIASKCISYNHKIMSSGVLQHMDKIIEEYITLDFINNEMLFNKKNYNRMVAQGGTRRGKDKDEENGAKLNLFGGNIEQLGASMDMLGSIRIKQDTPSPITARTDSTNHLTGEGLQDVKVPYINMNGKNFEALNYNEQRISNILKQALRIEEDQQDRFVKFKKSKIHLVDCDLHCSKTNVKLKLYHMKRKLKTVNKMKQINEAKLSCTKKTVRESKNEWLTKADKLFELLSKNEQDKFLDKMKDKIEKYDQEKQMFMQNQNF